MLSVRIWIARALGLVAAGAFAGLGAGLGAGAAPAEAGTVGAQALGAKASAAKTLGAEPIPLRSISPLRLLFYQPTPEGAATLGRARAVVSWDLSETNVLHIRNSPATEFDADLNLEITRLLVRFRLGLSDRWDLGFEAPFYRFHDGFLDRTIVDIEDFLGDPKIQREFERSQPGADRFRFFLKRNGEVFFERPGPRSGLGDIAVTAKRRLVEQRGRRPETSLRLALKLPTGRDEHAMGSGDVDIGVGLAADFERPRWSLYGNAAVTWPLGDPFEDAGLVTPLLSSGHLGWARRLGDGWIFLAQLAVTSGPFEEAGDRPPSPLPAGTFNNFGGSIVDVGLGASYELNQRTRMVLALVEDIHNTSNAAADVSLLVSFSIAARHVF